MRNKIKLFGLLVMALVMSSCGLYSCTPTEVTVKEDNDGEWRIYDNDGTNQGTWIVDEGEVLTWIVTGSEMDFLFPPDMGTYFEFSDGLFTKIDTVDIGGESISRRFQRIEEGDSLRLELKEREIDDDYDMRKPPVNVAFEYDIYVVKPGKYVVGNSPPYLIIRRSGKY